MKTVHIITHYIGGTGGVQVYNETLANILANQGYNVNLIGMAKQDKEAKINFDSDNHANINFICLNDEDIFFKKPHIFLKDLASKRVSKILSDIIKKEDIIIVSNPICMPFIAQILDWKKHNIIAQFHGSVQLAMEGRGMYKIYSFLINKYYSHVRKFLVLTEEDAQVLAKKYQFNNVDFLPNPSRFNFQTIQTKVETSKEILFLGRLDKIKQIDHIIKAFDKSRLFEKGYILNIYGDGPEKKFLENFIFKNSVQGVFLKGRTSNVELIMKESAVIVMASKSEGLPLNLLEAISIGLPILSYNTSAGIRELVKDGYNGKLVELNNIEELSKQLTAMIADKKKLLNYSENSYKLSEQFSKQNFQVKLEKFL